MAVMPMYHHYDECGTPCGHTTLNVCGTDTEVHYFHTHRDGVDLGTFFVSLSRKILLALYCVRRVHVCPIFSAIL
jgi:hypothetical protein|tara:strand:- start:13462 stop:13686 length:225 start_codon:yes stop_codon:yes gene_type:complete